MFWCFVSEGRRFVDTVLGSRRKAYRRCMARRPRSALPEFGFFHVVSRGVNRTTIFRAVDDRHLFVGLLDRTMRRCSWELLLDGKPLPSRSRGGTDRRFRRDAAAQRRLRAKLQRVLRPRRPSLPEPVWRETHRNRPRFGGTCRYVFDNPVRAGLCEQPEDWPWSGGRAHAALRWS